MNLSFRFRPLQVVAALCHAEAVARARRERSRAGTAPKRDTATVDEYLARVRPNFRALLSQVRDAIRAVAPRATETISYGIPTFKHAGHRLIYFSAAREHCTIHMIATDDLEAAARQGFRVGRGSIQFTPEKPLPISLVKRLVKKRLREIEAGERAT